MKTSTVPKAVNLPSSGEEIINKKSREQWEMRPGAEVQDLEVRGPSEEGMSDI